MRFGQHQLDERIRILPVNLRVLLQKGRDNSFRNEIGPADCHDSERPGMHDFQRKSDNAAVAVSVQRRPFQPHRPDELVHVFSHVMKMIFTERLICAVPSGIRRINLIPRFYELPDFRLKEIMIFSISVYQNNRTSLPDLGVMEGNAVHIYRMLCFVFCHNRCLLPTPEDFPS